MPIPLYSSSQQASASSPKITTVAQGPPVSQNLSIWVGTDTQWGLIFHSHFWFLKRIYGDGNKVFIGLQKNDDFYGIPHGTLNKKQTSNQQDSPHLPEFSNKTNLSIRIDVSP